MRADLTRKRVQEPDRLRVDADVGMVVELYRRASERVGRSAQADAAERRNAGPD